MNNKTNEELIVDLIDIVNGKANYALMVLFVLVIVLIFKGVL